MSILDNQFTYKDSVSLKEYIEKRLEAIENDIIEIKAWQHRIMDKETFKVEFNSLERATQIAAANLEKRLEGMNEFRQQIKDQTGTFVTRVEHGAVIDRFDGDIKSLRESRAMLEGKASQTTALGAVLLSGLGLLLAIVGILLRFV